MQKRYSRAVVFNPMVGTVRWVKEPYLLGRKPLHSCHTLLAGPAVTVHMWRANALCLLPLFACTLRGTAGQQDEVIQQWRKFLFNAMRLPTTACRSVGPRLWHQVKGEPLSLERLKTTDLRDFVSDTTLCLPSTSHYCCVAYENTNLLKMVQNLWVLYIY